MLSDDAKETLNLVSELNGKAPCKPIDPSNLLTVDDISLHLIEDTKDCRKDRLLAMWKETMKNKSHFSACDGEQKQSQSLGMSVKLTTTCTSSGLLAPIFMVINRLDASKLKLDKIQKFKECDGLCTI